MLDPSASNDADPDPYHGTETGRILGLTDAVFGFAITLLIVELIVPIQCTGTAPDSCITNALWDDKYVFLAYAFTFFVLGIWWVQHHALFRYIARYGPTLMWANLLFLLTIAVTPFVLRLVSGYLNAQVAVVVFSLVEAAAGFLLALTWEVAVRFRLLKPSATPTIVRRFRIEGLIAPAMFLVSAAVALISVPAAHVVWIAVFAVILALEFSRTVAHERASKRTG